MKQPKCMHCKSESILKDGSYIYPHRKDLKFLNFWVCVGCGAYVGCHKKGAKTDMGISDGTMPLGYPANQNLRQIRKETHYNFDTVISMLEIPRSGAYLQLAYFMNIKKHDCHIGMFSEADCIKVYEFADILMQG